MGYRLWFGKYKGTSLEEIALGKKCSGGKSEGYYYFNQLAKGEPQYFSYFQTSPRAMQRWNEVHTKLNKFKPNRVCPECRTNVPVFLSIASGKHGMSAGECYICCDDSKCKSAMGDYTKAMLYPMGFDTILQFGWNSGCPKYQEKAIQELLLSLVGWKGHRLNESEATAFIDSITLR